MAYNILGINPGHNGSAALISDGEVVYYLEEERLSRWKYDANPFRAILDIVSKWHVDEIVVAANSASKALGLSFSQALNVVEIGFILFPLYPTLSDQFLQYKSEIHANTFPIIFRNNRFF